MECGGSTPHSKYPKRHFILLIATPPFIVYTNPHE
jgi:hypothetical protein